MNPEPKDPFTPMATSAAGIHEHFMSLVQAGFTRAEALSLVQTMIHAFIASGKFGGPK